MNSPPRNTASPIPEGEYLVYQPAKSAEFSVELEAGNYTYEWYDPSRGRSIETGGIVSKGGLQKFKAPFDTDAVLYLKARR